MIRIRAHKREVDWGLLEFMALDHSKRIQYRVVRCEHGYTPQQSCHSCECGFVQDTSVYANIPDDVIAVAVSDDGDTVGFLR